MKAFVWRLPWSSLRRDLALLAVGLLLGTGIAVGVVRSRGGNAPPPGSAGNAPTTTVAGVTDTPFGRLTERSEEVGYRVRWSGEFVDGGRTLRTRFVTAHRDGTVVLHYDGGRVAATGDGRGLVCGGDGCEALSGTALLVRLPLEVRPFFAVLRAAPTVSRSPSYRITGEGDFGAGLVAVCGSYDPQAAGVPVPAGVVEVRQCTDEDTGLLVAVDLIGARGSLGGVSAEALADARPTDFDLG